VTPRAIAWRLALVSLLMPVVPLLHLYSRNLEELDGLFVAVSIGGFCALSAVVFGIARFLSRSPAAAFWVCLGWWTGLLVSKGLCTRMAGWLPAGLVVPLYMGLLVLVLVLVGLQAARHARPTGGLVAVSASVLGGMVLLNLVPVLVGLGQMGGWLRWGTPASTEAVDRRRPSPNIYWIHCDAMMGFRSFEACFGYDTTDFLGRLLDRGFEVNPNAMLEAARSTKVALPTLMCPDFYDSYLSRFLSTHEGAVRYQKERDWLKLERQLATRNELFLAFEAKGYLTGAVLPHEEWAPFLQPSTHRVYLCDTNQARRRTPASGRSSPSNRSYLKNNRQVLDAVAHPLHLAFSPLLDRVRATPAPVAGLTTSEAIRQSVVPRAEMEALLPEPYWITLHGPFLNGCVYALQESEAPSLMTLYLMVAHQPFTLDAEGDLLEPVPEDLEDPANYPGQYQVAKEVLIFLLDKILEKDPEAVIVLQADHGLHVTTVEKFEQAFGRRVPETELWNNVLCALRVPPKYRTGEESWAIGNPLNVTRYLVNSFVGRRYEYLEDSRPPED